MLDIDWRVSCFHVCEFKIYIYFSFKSWSYWILLRPCWVLVGQGYSSFIFTFYLYLQVCFSSIFNFYFLNILAPWIQICVDAAIHFIPKYCMSLSDLYSMHAKKIAVTENCNYKKVWACWSLQRAECTVEGLKFHLLLL